MQLPLQITFRHMDTSDAVAARIHERAQELERFFDRIASCRVVVECRHPRRRQGNLFRVRVDLKVPGAEIVVGREPAAHHAHEDVYVAVRDAFDAARRLLEDHVRQGRSEVKLHAVPDHGRIARLLPEQDCGFIAGADGNEIYFHRNIPRAPKARRRALWSRSASIISLRRRRYGLDPAKFDDSDAPNFATGVREVGRPGYCGRVLLALLPTQGRFTRHPCW
jgi:ribosomal subunit interface protein